MTKVDELIGRLRAFAAGCRGSMWQSRDETIRLMDQSAAAITDLQERSAALALQADEWEGKYAIVSDLNADLQAQVAALRDALEEIRDYPRPTILNAFNREKCMEHIATKALAQYAGKDHDDA